MNQLKQNNSNFQEQINDLNNQLNAINSEDQVKKNQFLADEILEINQTFQQSLKSYDEIVRLEDKKVNVNQLKTDFAQILSLLSNKKYEEAKKTLASLDKKIADENGKLTQAAISLVKTVAVNNQPPGSGYQRQTVESSSGSFVVDIVTADLNSTKVIVDTASDSDCGNDCPVLPLATYIARNGAFAGVNGSYFCPSTYTQCAGKTNSFDTLLMNKNKTYFNSANNVYSEVPAMIFSGNSARLVSKSSEWGRDTSVDAVIANRPMLIQNGNITFGGNNDAKETNKGGRSFVGVTGSNVYIGVVRSATVAEAAIVLKTLGIENAINLDDGGSTALWSGGYKVGPGRDIPNALLLIKK